MKKIKFLIIDDELVDRLLYQKILKEHFDLPYEILEAETAAKALQLLTDHQIDFILLDYQLPDINGIDLLQKIKHQYGKYLPIIMFTGQGSEDVAVNAMKLGVADYLIKNKMDPLLLVAKIKNAIINLRLKKIIHKQKKQLEHYYYYDFLTGTMNRYAFEQMLAHAFNNAKKWHRAIAVLLLDLDDFTTINDTLGHIAGNEILAEISTRMKHVLPDEVLLARWGDDEFAIMLSGENIDDIGSYTAAIAKHLIEKIGEPYQIVSDIVHVKTSIGIACYPNGVQSHLDLLKHAGIALSRAKKLSRGMFQFFSEELTKAHEKKFKLETSLRKAIIADEFDLLYQPIFSLADKRCIGFEVSFQWIHPTLGRLSPALFMSIAEKAAMTTSIGKWLFDTLGQQLANLKELYPHDLFQFQFAINLHLFPRQLSNIYISDSIKKIFNLLHNPSQSNKTRSSVQLEMNDTLMREYQHNPQLLADLPKLCLQLVIDDFKIDYTAFIHALPITSIKLSETLLKHENMAFTNAFIRSIISFSSDFGVSVVVNNVTTEQEFDLLRRYSCQQALGNYFCPPLKISALIEWLHTYLNTHFK